MNTNSENPKVGRLFQEISANILSDYFGVTFGSDIAIPIGAPAKPHKFDCVSSDKKIVGECKCYTWTETGNIPSAKMGFLNEAVFYLNYLPNDIIKLIVMKKATHVKRNETLAEYYLRTNRHLLQGIKVIEINTEDHSFKTIKD